MRKKAMEIGADAIILEGESPEAGTLDLTPRSSRIYALAIRYMR